MYKSTKLGISMVFQEATSAPAEKVKKPTG
jgi:hypothetical protein